MRMHVKNRRFLCLITVKFSGSYTTIHCMMTITCLNVFHEPLTFSLRFLMNLYFLEKNTQFKISETTLYVGNRRFMCLITAKLNGFSVEKRPDIAGDTCLFKCTLPAFKILPTSCDSPVFLRPKYYPI